MFQPLCLLPYHLVQFGTPFLLELGMHPRKPWSPHVAVTSEKRLREGGEAEPLLTLAKLYCPLVI